MKNRNKLFTNAFVFRYLNTRIVGKKLTEGDYFIEFIKVRARTEDDHPGKRWHGFNKVIFRNNCIYTIYNIRLTLEAIEMMFGGVCQLENYIKDLKKSNPEYVG